MEPDPETWRVLTPAGECLAHQVAYLLGVPRKGRSIAAHAIVLEMPTHFRRQQRPPIRHGQVPHPLQPFLEGVQAFAKLLPTGDPSHLVRPFPRGLGEMGTAQEVKRPGFPAPRTPLAPGRAPKRQDARLFFRHRQSTARKALPYRLQEPARLVRVLGADDTIIRVPEERCLPSQTLVCLVGEPAIIGVRRY